MAFGLTLLVFFAAACSFSASQKDTVDGEFLFVTIKDNVTSCVTNSYKPLFWTAAETSDDHQLHQQVSTFTRYRPSSPLVNCDFDLSENCTSLWTGPNSPWKSSNSLAANLNVSLLDFRWENLQLIETGTENDQPGGYWSKKNGRKLNASSFEIGISFRLKNQGQIFLCESTAPDDIENCHAFVIDVDNSSLKSFSARCENLRVLGADFDVAKQCSGFSEVEVVKSQEIFALESLKADSEPDIPCFDRFWVHVKLRKTDDRNVELQLTNDEFDLRISEFAADFSSGPDVSYVVLLNSNSYGDLWKFHDYQFIYTTESSRSFRLQPALKPENTSSICMFVYLCPVCFLRVRMISAVTGQVYKPRYKPRYKPSDYFHFTSNWAQVAYNSSEIAEEYYLEIFALQLGNDSQGYWAIDHIRYCHDFEYRMLELPKSSKKQGAKCELVPKTRPRTKNLYEVELAPHYNFTDAENNCPENTLGSICLPCEFVFGQSNCSGVGVCENKMGGEVCYCAGSGTPPEKQICAANNFLTDDKKSFSTGGYLGSRTYDVILIVGVTFGATLLFVCIVIFVMRKVKTVYKTGESIAPDLIQTSQLPSYKRLESTRYEVSGKKTKPRHLIKMSGRRKSTTRTSSKPVPVEQFENYVQEIVRSGDINDQLKSLIPEQRLYSVIRGPVNSGYETPIDVIFADSYKSPKSFVIVVQGNKKSIKPQDFWPDVLKKDIRNIVWIAMDEKTKLWPELNENWNFNGVRVETVIVRNNRTTLKLEGAPRDEHGTKKTVHLHPIIWESHIPLCSQKLSKISLELLKVSPSSKSPILIFNNTSDLNKSATVLLCDSCLRMVAQEGQVDVYGQLKTLTNQIPPLFANFKYYPLVHYTVLESFVQLDAEIDCQELNDFIGKDLYKFQICYVERLLPDSSVKVLKQHEVRTHVYVNFPEISAVYVNGFRASKKFIAAPQPLKAHFEEFWNLVVELDVSVIVTLNQHNNKFMQNSEVLLVSTETYNNYDVFVGSVREQTITIVCLRNWPFTEALPRNLENFVDFFEKSISIPTGSKKVLVTCRDGVNAAGVYVALSYLVEQIKAGKLCDVPKAIQNARRSKNEFVRKKTQIKFLYRAADAYVQLFPEKLEK